MGFFYKQNCHNLKFSIITCVTYYCNNTTNMRDAGIFYYITHTIFPISATSVQIFILVLSLQKYSRYLAFINVQERQTSYLVLLFASPSRKKIFRGRFFVGVYISWSTGDGTVPLGGGGSKERQTEKAFVINGIRSFPTVTLFLSIPSHCNHVAQE